jgi:hypothetical protein
MSDLIDRPIHRSAPAMQHRRERYATGLSLGSRLLATEPHVPIASGFDAANSIMF